MTIDHYGGRNHYPQGALLTIVAIILALLVIPPPWGWAIVIVAAVIDVLETWFFCWWSKRRGSVVGADNLVGRHGIVVTTLAPRGKVRVLGELWEAESPVQVDPGLEVVVRGVRGLALDVEPPGFQA